MPWSFKRDSDGKYLIEVDGADVTKRVTAATLDASASGEPLLTLQVTVVDVVVFGEDQPLWVGLGQVPASALVQELKLRGLAGPALKTLTYAAQSLDAG